MLLHRFVQPEAGSGDPAVRMPTPDDVDRLRAVVGPCLVTITVATEPSPTGMDTAAAFRLAAALAEVERRARLDLALREAIDLVERCRRLAVDIIDEPTGRGVSIFVGPGGAEAYRLAVEPTERVVLASSFEIGGLERSVEERPPVVVVHVGEDRADLLVVDDVGVARLDEAASPAPPSRPTALRRWSHQVAWAAERAAGRRRLPIVLIGAEGPLDSVADHLGASPLAVLHLGAGGLEVMPADAELATMVRAALASTPRLAGVA